MIKRKMRREKKEKKKTGKKRKKREKGKKRKKRQESEESRKRKDEKVEAPDAMRCTILGSWQCIPRGRPAPPRTAASVPRDRSCVAVKREHGARESSGRGGERD